MKKSISLLITIILLLSIFPFYSYAEETETEFPIGEEPSAPSIPDSGTYCGGGLMWTLEAGTLHIYGSGDMFDYEDVTVVPWYDDRENISVISLDPEMTGIGSYAFSVCSSVSSVFVPAGIQKIGFSAFSGTTRLLALPASVAETYALENGNPFSALVSMPVISSLSNVFGGISLKWNAVDNAQLYRVFRRTAVSGWIVLTDTEYCSYTDTAVESGTEYFYSVQCYSEDGSVETSSFSDSGKSVAYVAAPRITGISAANSGIHITWEHTAGALKYRVFRKTEGSIWMRVGDTGAASFTDTNAIKGTAYCYTVRCIDERGNYVSSYDPLGKSFTMSPTPEISAVSNTADGVRITWGRIDGVSEYRVYRKTASGSWGRIGNTVSCSYTDHTAASGTTYSYTVRCLDSEGILTSDYDPAGKSIRYVAAPEISGISAANGGVHIVWGKVNGAAKYRVFRKNEGGSWVRIGDTEAGSFTDLTAARGKAYTYTVRCIDSSGNYISSFDAVGKNFTMTGTPSLTGVSNICGGVRISWGQIPGAVSYRVYRKTSGGWGRIGETSSTAFTDRSAASGTSYSYTVRCLDSAGILTSDFDPVGRSILYIAAPPLGSISNTSAGVLITWNRVTGASGYRVFRKTGTGTWTRIADTTGTSYTDTEAVSGISYIYTVRCTDSAGNYISSYDSAGLSVTYFSAPAVKSVTNTVNGVRINWTRVNAAAKYRIYRKTADGTWSEIADTTAVTYTDVSAESGISYSYMIRCLDASGIPVSDYDKEVKTILYIAAPLPDSIRNAMNGVEITWGTVSGAPYYRVFRKTDAGTWKKIGDTADTVFTDTSAESGVSHTYTVRCLDLSGNYISAYHSGGISITYVAAPRIGNIAASNGGVRIVWELVAGAGKYRVYRKTDSGSWEDIGETTASSFTDRSIEIGSSYTYTLQCLDADGTPVSDFDPSGRSLSPAETPVLAGVSNTDTGVRISWSETRGAEKYRVFRKSGGGTWSRIGDTYDLFYTDISAASGTEYIFTVRCVNSAGDYCSDYDHAGKSVLYVAAPVITSLSTTDGGVRIVWGEVTGAAKYRVFRKTDSGGWTRIGDTSSTSFTDANVESVNTYSYTVRCLDASGSYSSSYNSGASITVYSKKIYLSPSNQDANTFITGNTNEGDVWNDIAVRLADLLADYDCDVRIADFDMVLDDRAEEANQWGADVYIAMHSNAYVTPNTCRGIEVYYDANKENSDEREALATAFLNELSALFVNRGLRTANYLKECRLPEMPSVIVECGYHDTVSDANLILGNKDRIAQLYCSALVGYLGLTRLSEYNH